MPITDPGQEYFKDGGWSWDGSTWVKNNPPFGYIDVYGEEQSIASTAAGTNVLLFSQVPEGEVWVVTNISGVSSDTNVTLCQLETTVDGIPIVLRRAVYTVVYQTVDWQGMLVMKEGDRVRVSFTTCLATKYVGGYAVGYKMRVS